jgi:hypothetical protein
MDRTEAGHEGVYCIHLAQNTVQWRAVLNTLPEINLRVLSTVANFSTS